MADVLSSGDKFAEPPTPSKACRVHRFGPPDVITLEDFPPPAPGAGEVLVRVKAAGVGPWDAWIRAGKSALPQPLPLTLGSDLAGVVEAVGPGVANVAPGDAVFGVTNPHFIGSYADYALAAAGMIAKKPAALGDVDAASVPVVAVTAWQALFDQAQVMRGQTVLVHGGAGNVGAYVVQLAHRAGLRVIATAGETDLAYVRHDKPWMALSVAGLAFVLAAFASGEDYVMSLDKSALNYMSIGWAGAVIAYGTGWYLGHRRERRERSSPAAGMVTESRPARCRAA